MKDLFSKQADIYAKYRPNYPGALIDFVLSFVAQKDSAWDCATGNGQAAFLMAPFFQSIKATDISQKQIDNARQHERITYSTGSAEKSGFEDNSFDLITVAQAYHWFQFGEFFQEATRVSKPDGIVAVWGYGLIKVQDAALSSSLIRFYTDTVGKYWDSERKYVEEGYKTIPFYFQELPSRDFSIEVSWTREDLIGYLNSWSSVQHYIKATQHNPVYEFARQVSALWEGNENKLFSFPVFMRLGIIRK
jgi:SAM-dependent methyltransferase